MKKGQGIVIMDGGDNVNCDICNDDFFEGDNRSGGFLFSTYSYCPKCAAESIERIRSLGEEHCIRAHCPIGMSFRHWVLELRKDPTTWSTTLFVKNEP